MTAFYIYKTANVLLFQDKWSYGMGRHVKTLRSDESFFSMTSAKKKKKLLDAVRIVDSGEFTISGRNGKYAACAVADGRPTWYIYVEETDE